MAEKMSEKIAKLQAKMQQDLQDSFTKYDTDADGNMSIAEFKDCCRKKSIKFNDKIFEDLDVDGNGKISPEEFNKMFAVEHQWKLKLKV